MIRYKRSTKICNIETIGHILSSTLFFVIYIALSYTKTVSSRVIFFRLEICKANLCEKDIAGSYRF